MKLAIIGGGPSAFYVASRIFQLLPAAKPSSPSLRIHLFDRLWAPHGLVRYGVAPDHPEVKNCTHKFDAAALDPRLRFFGNVNVGDPANPIPHAINLPLSSIFKNYTHILFSTGCTLPTLHPALPPSTYCIPALSLVHWYTQHPTNPPPPPLENVSHVSLIGNGNVSLDVARMLLTNPDVLSKYDVPQHVIDHLSRSNVKHVSIIGRRGPLEAAFTTKELREMINLPEASMIPLDLDSMVPVSKDSLTRQQSRVLQLLAKGSAKPYGTTSKTWSLDFLRSPVGLAPPSATSQAQLKLAHTKVDAKTSRAVPTGETSVFSTDLVTTSLGFRSPPSSLFSSEDLGHLRTISGRLVSSSGHVLQNAYASGWASTGAKGVLASTMIDAYAVADTILTDLMPKDEPVKTTPASPTREQGVADDDVAEIVMNPNPHPEDPPEEIKEALKEGMVTTYSDWKKVDEEEVRRGEVLGKERERMGWEEAREFLTKTKPRT
ncbi:hypothetical protein BDQ12DRAFT_694469 [Crucibulum laeve]|uniref:NADPH:adrenodoxin oxidoreductase, mitochondrial n=1 Tax=Crucibulum laeve TaxID=68775 RepID=A0A5C3LDK7_9AGAR|nr:hypothetical protein BDQ12DRAFT_694469 [Crucibulum laeve]